MPHAYRKHVQKKRLSTGALARIHTAIAAASDSIRSYDRQRFAWGFVVSLSAVALVAYNPAMAHDTRSPDAPLSPPDPDRSLSPRNDQATMRTAGSLPGHSIERTDSDRKWSHPMRVAVEESQHELPVLPFDIPAGELDPALMAFSRQSGLQLLYSSELVSGLTTRGVQGEHTPESALRTLLNETGMQYRFSNPNTITLQRVSQGEPAAGATAAAAAQASQSKPVKVPEIVVQDVVDRTPANDPNSGYKADYASTSTRSNLSIDETPTSIGIVTRDIIRDTFARTQGDAFEGVSGVSRSNTRLGRAEGINIRGFQVNGFDGSFNGLKANGLPTDGVFAPDWAIVERYEIVKGPASIVGGAANPGGVINRITKTPQRYNFTTVESNVGSYGLARGVVDANGVLPNNDNIRGRLVVAIEDGGNFIDYTPARQYTVAPSVEFDLFKGAGKLLLVGTYQSFDGASYPGWPLTSEGRMLDVPRTRNFGGGIGSGARTRFTGYNGEAHYDHKFLHDIKLSVKGKYSKSDLSDKTVYSYTFGGIQPSGDSYLNNGFRHNRFDTYAGELTLSKEFSLFGQKHEILAGVDHRDMTQNFFLGYSYLPSNGAPFLDNVFNPRNGFQALSDNELRGLATQPFRVNLKQTGAFAQAVVRPFERLTLVFAGRHDTADSRYRNTATLEQNEQTKSALTGRFGATLKLTSWMNVYAGLQQSFQPQPFGLTRDGKMLDPETGINYEAGAKFNFFEERLRVTTAVFRTYRENVSTLDPNDLTRVIAVGEQRHQGVELDINGQPTPGLNLSAAVSYLDAEITQDNDTANIGSIPTRVPRSYVGRIFATYQIQSGFLQGFGVGGGVYFQSGFELSLPNRHKTDSYERVDAVLFYRGSKRYDVALNIRNLLNTTYIESPGGINAYNGFGAPITAIGTVRVFF